jgi:hypothetical protein
MFHGNASALPPSSQLCPTQDGALMIDGHTLATYKLAINYIPHQNLSVKKHVFSNLLFIPKGFFMGRGLLPNKRHTSPAGVPLTLYVTVVAVCTVCFNIQNLRSYIVQCLWVFFCSRNEGFFSKTSTEYRPHFWGSEAPESRLWNANRELPYVFTCPLV